MPYQVCSLIFSVSHLRKCIGFIFTCIKSFFLSYWGQVLIHLYVSVAAMEARDMVSSFCHNISDYNVTFFERIYIKYNSYKNKNETNHVL